MTSNINLLAIGSLLTAVVAIIISLRQMKVHKYEVKHAYYCEILQWFSDCTETLIKLRHLPLQGHVESTRQKDELLCHLSALIETGRFYFPNIKSANRNSMKPAAYKGIRHDVLNKLVRSYELFKASIPNIEATEQLRREFTSLIFEILSPAKQIVEISVITNTRFYK